MAPAYAIQLFITLTMEQSQEKKWFKHQFGFVNIDAENCYITKTGNWSEVQKLSEKNSMSFRSISTKDQIKLMLYFVPVTGLLIFLFTKNLMGGDISLLLLIGLPLAGYAIYKYWKPEFNSSFVIPKSKIQDIEIGEKQIVIQFLDGENKENSFTLSKIDDKAFVIMQDLREELK